MKWVWSEQKEQGDQVKKKGVEGGNDLKIHKENNQLVSFTHYTIDYTLLSIGRN